MRIVMDMQGAQTESRFRGLGRYSLSFAKAIIRNRGNHEIFLILNGLFQETIEPIRAEFENLLPQENIRIWYSPSFSGDREDEMKWKQNAAGLIRETCISELKPDIISIPSFFEGFGDNSVTTIGRLDRHTPVCVNLHDVIPLLYPDQYLDSRPLYKKWYLDKIHELGRASLLLSISESAGRDAMPFLDNSSSILVNISSAIDEVFRPLSIDADVRKRICHQFRIEQPFILFVGAGDPRKNLIRLIQSYSRLPEKMRSEYQLVIAGKLSAYETKILNKTAASSNLSPNRLVLTGYVSDNELVILYNLCRLFVFPSWHEGFGLPPLEAMACGAAVISSNTSSLPEVIGYPDALFDPLDVSSIQSKLMEVLEDKDFHSELVAHGLRQVKKFSWDATAKRAVSAYEMILSQKRLGASGKKTVNRPRLAFVSPLPPERTGIAHYSAELLPDLSHFYEIDVVVAQSSVDDEWTVKNCAIRDIDWFRNNADLFDRVLYQFGNSPFHQHMLDLLVEIPGTMVMHDFYLSSLYSYLEMFGVVPNAWIQELYQSHGYHAVKDRFQLHNLEKVKITFPVNMNMLEHANGVIVHSAHSKRLGQIWYGMDSTAAWEIIPLLRKPTRCMDRNKSRAILGLRLEDFVICAFGFLDETKLNHRLIKAFLDSRLSETNQCALIFVGQNHGGEYGRQILSDISCERTKKRISITGWVNDLIYQQYLAAADVAVQLRTLSRGETSASVLDCMNAGLAVIVNAHGSLGELPADAVWMLPDSFEDGHLIHALENLWKDDARRHELGNRARSFILMNHAPRLCAEKYADAIERNHAASSSGINALAKEIVNLNGCTPTEEEWKELAQSIMLSVPSKYRTRQLLLDVSATSRNDRKSGIERVVRSLVKSLLESPTPGFRVEPVYLSQEGGFWHHRYARRFSLSLLDCPADGFEDDIVEPQNGDIMIVMDLSDHKLIDAAMGGLFEFYRNHGLSIHSIVYDLLPVEMPRYFPPGAAKRHSQWLRIISGFDGVVCISETVASGFYQWIQKNIYTNQRSFQIGWFDLGSDIRGSAPTHGLPDNASDLLRRLEDRPSFLMVGTVEPRKGYLDALESFSHLWAEGLDINLVVVGNEGWKDLPDHMRRNIPEIVARINNHSEINRRLFWLQGISDEFLELVYKKSVCLIAASEGEGFGLPLIEAAYHNLPVIARDIPVFREVMGENGLYFNGAGPVDLKEVVKEFLLALDENRVVKLNSLRPVTWKESTVSLLEVVIENKRGYWIKGKSHSGKGGK